MTFLKSFSYIVAHKYMPTILVLLLNWMIFPGVVNADNESASSRQGLSNQFEIVPKDCVILIHGLGRSSGSMFFISRYLKRKNYQVVSVSYPSTDHNIESLAAQYIPPAIEACQSATKGRIHFVTHSLGGILVRQFFQDQSYPSVQRVVMLSPPNKGCEVSDFLEDSILYRWLNGPAGQQLSTASTSLPNQLNPIGLEVGVITGNSSYEPWFSRLSEGEDDGKVSVESARLEEMADFLVVPNNHTFIMNDSYVKFQVDQFLKTGLFAKGALTSIQP